MLIFVTFCDAENLKGNVNSAPIFYAIQRSDIKYILVLKFTLRPFYIIINCAITSGRFGSARLGSDRVGSARIV